MKAIFFPDIELENPNNGVFNTLYIPEILEEIYIKRVYQEIFEDKSNLTVIDLGGNIGLATGYFRQFANKVYTLEPDHRYFEALSRNKDFNKWDNVEIFNAAISSKSGTATFYPNESNRTASSLDNPFYDILKTQHQYGKSYSVQTMALDTFLEVYEIKTVDFMKMDIEGQEDEIIKSQGFRMIANKIKSMLVEFHNPNYEPLVNILTELGFSGKKLTTDTVNYLFTRKDL